VPSNLEKIVKEAELLKNYKNNILSDVIAPGTNGLVNLKKLPGGQRTNESLLKQNL